MTIAKQDESKTEKTNSDSDSNRFEFFTLIKIGFFHFPARLAYSIILQLRPSFAQSYNNIIMLQLVF